MSTGVGCVLHLNTLTSTYSIINAQSVRSVRRRLVYIAAAFSKRFNYGLKARTYIHTETSRAQIEIVRFNCITCQLVSSPLVISFFT